MKNKKILIILLILMASMIIWNYKVQAASAEISASKANAEVGESVVITAKFAAAAWNLKVSGDGITGESYASQTSDLSEAQNTKTFNLNTSKAGTYTINIKGDITDKDGNTQEINKSCTITIKEKTVTPTPEPEPEPQPEPEPTPEQKPENPTKKELEFTSINNKTMYLEKSTNFRSEYKINNSNIIAKLSVGTEVIQIGISKTQSEGHIWTKIIYNGKTGYVINENLTQNKPEEKQYEPAEETKDQESEVTTEKPKNDETSKVTGGLKNLEIEGLSLTPTFSSNVYEYRVIVKENLSELKINAVAAIENATITIAGNQNLQEGENIITIIIYNAKKEVEATYQITANKSTLDLSSTDKMLQIGTEEATRNLIIFIAALAIVIIILIVVLILKHRNDYEYYDEEEEFTDFDENVGNIQNNVVQDEYQGVKREKRKGKHF